MHERVNKSSSWTPTSSQKKSKSLYAKPSTSIQPKQENISSQQQEMQTYSTAAADLLAANIMRSLEPKEPESSETSTGKLQSETGQAAFPLIAAPIPSTPVVQSQEIGIQRQCSECAKEQSTEEGKDINEISLAASGIQTKLTIGAPPNPYQQAANQMAEVMSKPILYAPMPQVQRFSPEESQIQLRAASAQSISPMMQMSVEQQAQMSALIQRTFRGEGTQASFEPVQAKLTVGEPGDKYEQEADAVAHQVVEQINAPKTEGLVQRQSELGGAILSQITVMRKSAAGVSEGASVTQDVEQGIQQARGGGQTLDESVREPMEKAFGADFSGVRVHTNGNADQLNRSISARAFTTGQDIFFKQGEYNPGSRGGQELLAHELTHVVQQTGVVHRKGEAIQEPLIGRSVLQREPSGSGNSTEQLEENPYYEMLEADYQKQGEEFITKLEGKAASSSNAVGGDTGALDVPKYGAWFSRLQKLLIQRQTWGKEEEEAQHLLQDYASWRASQSSTGSLPPTLEFLFRYVGRSEANDKAIKGFANNAPRTGELGGAGAEMINGTLVEAKNWCAQAASTPLTKLLREKGLRFKSGFDAWLNKGKGKKFLIGQPKSTTADLFPGDVITLIGSGTPVSGHVATIIEHKGDQIVMISGNAGGGGGSVRIEQVTREQPPAGYNYFQELTSAKKPGKNLPAQPGKIWVVVVERLSQFDLSQVDPNNDEQLQELGLERIPIQAKLTVGQPGDKYEQEADSVARQVVEKINSTKPQPSVQRQSAGVGTTHIQQVESGSGSLIQRQTQPAAPVTVGSFSPSPGLFVDRTGQSIRITGRVEVYGDEANAARASQVEATIERIWNATFPDGFRVSCDVNVTYRPSSQDADSGATQIEVTRTASPSHVSRGLSGRYMVLNMNESDALNWTAAHEFGHLLGMDDRYTESLWSTLSGTFGGTRHTPPNPGYEGNLMAETGGVIESKNIRDLGEENAPGLLDDDDQVRDWVSHHSLADVGRLPTQTKILMINTLFGGWISDEDVATIGTICRSMTSRTESTAIRNAITPRLLDMTSIGQRTQVRVFLSQMP